MRERKKREYQERLRNVEHADFTPQVIATTGGIGPAGSVMLKRLAQNLAGKREMHICGRRMASMPPFFRYPSFGIDLSSWVPTLQTQE